MQFFSLEKNDTLLSIEIHVDYENLFFLFNFLQLHEIIYFLPCIFENTVFSQKFVGKIGAPIFNRLIPPSLALAGSHLFKFEEAERWLWSSSLGSLTTPHLPASRSFSIIERGTR